jgi:hypothetical protein
MPEPKKKSTPRAGKATNQTFLPEGEDILCETCKLLGRPFEDVLSWKMYADRIVILFATGQKVVRRLAA